MLHSRWRQKLFQGRAWLHYWLEAVNEHSLHPPFIYSLYKEVIKPVGGEIAAVEALRKQLLHSGELLQIRELGAGSSISSKLTRSVASIARNSLTPVRFSCLLYRLIQYCQAKTILELGSSLGINTLYLAAAAPHGVIHTLEGCPQTAAVASRNFTTAGATNVQLHIGNIDEVLPQLLQAQPRQIDMAYLDANHTYAATMRYFEWLLPRLHPASVVVVDDIHWSEGMQKAWTEMCSHPKVSLSLDVFDAGLLFFNPQLQQQHWILEY